MPNRTEEIINAFTSLHERNKQTHQRVFSSAGSTADVHCAHDDVMRVQELFGSVQLIARDIATALHFF